MKINRLILVIKVILVLLSATFTGVNAQEGFRKIIIEKIPVTPEALADDPNLLATDTAYRIFIELAANYEMQIVYGGTEENLVFKTTTRFYNNADFGGTTGKEISANRISSNPAVGFDSYITINAAANNLLGILRAEDITDGIQDGYIAGTALGTVTIGADFSLPFGTENTEKEFSMVDCAYNVLGGEVGPTDKNRVLLGQFTTNGAFSFEINVQIRQTDGITVENYVARNGNEIQYQEPELHYPAPATQITFPLNGSTVQIGQNVTIAADASSIFGLKEVEFYINGEKVATDNEAPFTYAWVAAAGTTSLKTIARDSLSGTNTSVTVIVTGANSIAPEVSLTSPVMSSTHLINVPLTISANASDLDGTVSKVEFFANSVKIGTDDQAPYQIDWTPLSAGNVDIIAVATDNQNLETSTSVTTITVYIQTGNSELENSAPVYVFPNPSGNIMTLRLSDYFNKGRIKIEVFDLHGRSAMVQETEFDGMSRDVILDLTNLSRGNFYLKVTDAQGISEIIKFIKE